MTIDEEVRAALLAWSGLTAIVGQRIRFDMALEADAPPFVVIRGTSADRIRGLDNSVHAKSKGYQIECWGRTRVECSEIAEAATDALEVADMPPEPSDPDGVDPETLERAAVLNVTVWT